MLLITPVREFRKKKRPCCLTSLPGAGAGTDGPITDEEVCSSYALRVSTHHYHAHCGTAGEVRDALERSGIG